MGEVRPADTSAAQLVRRALRTLERRSSWLESWKLGVDREGLRLDLVVLGQRITMLVTARRSDDPPTFATTASLALWLQSDDGPIGELEPRADRLLLLLRLCSWLALCCLAGELAGGFLAGAPHSKT